MSRKQCKLCPWRKDVDPRDIPNGYCEKLHRALEMTMAEPGALPTSRALRIFACHETPVDREKPCVGWLMHQLGPGNNIGLRLAVHTGRISVDVELVGAQHERLEDTFPRRKRRDQRKRA